MGLLDRIIRLPFEIIKDVAEDVEAAIVGDNDDD